MFNPIRILLSPLRSLISLFILLYTFAVVSSHMAVMLHGAFTPICGLSSFSSTSFCTMLDTLASSSLPSDPTHNRFAQAESMLLTNAGRNASNALDAMRGWLAMDELIVVAGTVNSSRPDLLVERIADAALVFREISLASKPLESALGAYHGIVLAAAKHVRQQYSRDKSVIGPNSLFCYLLSTILVSDTCRAGSGAALVHFLDITYSSLGNLSSLMQPIVEAHERAERHISDIRTTVSAEQNIVQGTKAVMEGGVWARYGLSSKESSGIVHMLGVLVRLEEGSNSASTALVEAIQRLVSIQSDVERLHGSTITLLRAGVLSPDIVVDTLIAAVEKITSPTLVARE
ncbi:hypothetical protein PLICRDRAFT_174266 [Plicaturopsis crispa FD-325 SS-3]|nr:hypothetical protein PLICRDRAFT_174266 [Plicaturopsis crispa FD-325 SS-3]